MHMREDRRVELTHFVSRVERSDVRWGGLFFGVECPSPDYVRRREGDVVVMRGSMRRKFLLASIVGGLAETLTR